MNQNIIISILLSVIIIQAIIIAKMYIEKEGFTATDEQFVLDLVIFLKSKPSYTKYLTFLIENKNKSSNLIIKSNYIRLLEEVEKGTLSKETIINLM